MKTSTVNYQLAQGYQDFEPLLVNIKQKFTQDDLTVIHQERNVLKALPYKDKQIIAKAFKIPNKLNQWVYGTFRDSKAKRSFLYSQQLRSLGINTPKPIGYIEYCQGLLLKQSYYLSEKFDEDFTIRPVLHDLQWPEREAILKATVEFAYQMHQTGALHLDFSPGNILIKKEQDEYRIAICDVNRMKFGAVSFHQGLENFVRLIQDQQTSDLIAEIYAELDGQSAADAKQWLTKVQTNYLNKRQKLAKIKAFFR